MGDWEFKVERTKFNTDSIGYYEHDSLSCLGEIIYGNSDKEGLLSNFPTHYCSGKFDGNEKLHLYLRWEGLGGGVTHLVYGEKK